MMLKVNDIFLDFNADIEIERKVKLFQNIEKTDGDMSFAFDVELTSNNIIALQLPFPDSGTKNVYHTTPTEVLDENGITINKGSIRIESIIGRIASCSFLGGNSNWFASLTGNMTDLNLSSYDKEVNATNIINSWNEHSGIVYPIIDTGTLITRGFQIFVTDDFVGTMYLHTMLKETFKQSGLKLEGELINDPFFKSLVVVTNTRSIRDVNNNKYNVARTADLLVPALTSAMSITIDTYTTPYYIGDDVVVVSDQDFYVSADMLIEIELTTKNTSGLNFITPSFRINGVLDNRAELISGKTGSGKYYIKYRMRLDKGEYLSFVVGNQFGSDQTLDLFTSKLTPLSIYKSFGASSVPLWDKQTFVSNILSIFNTLVKYDDYTKTVTINLFDKIKTKPSIDISEFIEIETTDYTEFISDYGRSNNFTYEEGDDEDLLEYNISSFIKYGSGSIHADNDFIEESVDIIESDFTTPISYIHPVLQSSMERIRFVEFIEDNNKPITSVTDNGSGNARFHITDADDYYSVGELIRIETDIPSYNADFRVSGVTSTYVDVSVADYDGDTTGNATRLTHKLTTDDSVYLMSVTKQIDNNDFSESGIMFLNTTSFTESSLAFFNLIRLGRTIESNYKQGLSFDVVNNQTSFQYTLLDRYWRQFERVINDPVMEKCRANLPWKVYNSIDFLSPITIRTIESSNQYYCNKITGYKNRYTPCLVELIKLP